MLDIRGLDMADVLAVLYNAASPHGMGFLQTEHAPLVMNRSDARRVIDERGDDLAQYRRELGATPIRLTTVWFKYVFGRPIACSLTGNLIDEQDYDQYHGQGAAAYAIAELRLTGNVMTDRIFSAHARRLQIEAEQVLQDPERYTALEKSYGMGDFTERLVELTRRAMGGQGN